MFYRNILRPVLFRRDSEEIHDFTLSQLGWVSRNPLLLSTLESFLKPAPLPLDLWGLRFPNPVGLAAGMDKHAAALPAWSAMGFGFCELGGVTWHPQPGNPRPRMFRALADGALINRMGFNNSGALAMADTLAHWKEKKLWPGHPVGVNLGKSKITPLNEAPHDYTESFKALRDWVDFFVVNVSSPNTPNLRQLQDKEALQEILHSIQSLNLDGKRPPKPLLVKVAPDLTPTALDEIAELVSPCSLSGIVATNTTIHRPPASGAKLQQIYTETGGLSGRPLKKRSTEVVRHLYRATGGKLPIIGVGGIFNAEDAWEKITAGASLVQVYSGLVYEGPQLARRIVEGLSFRLELEGLPTLNSAIGIAAGK